ncbi:hypothetical protein Aple_089280 [Acrocarpospora pleiomorpha]|uniref:CBS domain-containing protein n=1 Tax=Acrocarpospora pleiomorpha TaxID=90975 RepID=A0A5M3Y1G1_9ACTN|nr:CBS domain-containing protein [Acrocarpospora pleiomorpha]GES26029.1 hypothetical protein Aple_089280 [Acrocarpospora pleiomorpha]
MSIEVKDVMGRVAIVVLENAPFTDIVATMKRYAVGAVTVIDADRRPVGVVSGDDPLLKETRDQAAGVTAVQLMTSPAVTVTPGTAVRDAARLMHGERVKQLPVIDPVTGRIVGTLHQRDVLRILTRPVPELEADIRTVLPEALSIAIDQGVVTIGGRVQRSSQAIAVVEAVRAVEGVVDVVNEVSTEQDDLLIVPPLP